MSLTRVQDYLSRGYSAARVAELIEWPIAEVAEMKRDGDFEPTTRKEKAVHLVLRGKSIEKAAKATDLPVITVRRAVEDAKSKIEQLAVLAEQMPRQIVVDRI